MTANKNNRMPIIVCVGEVLWDCFPDRKVLGGAPYNLAYIAQNIGAKSVMVSAIGNDADGKQILAVMAEKGMDSAFIQKSDHPTGTVQVKLSASGEPSYTIVEGVAYDDVRWTDSMQNLVKGCDAICFGSLAQRNSVTRETLFKMLDHADRAVRVYDINLRQAFYSKEILEAGFKRSQVVKMNDGEVEVLKKMFPKEFAGGEESFLKAFDIDLLAVTRGANGCSLYRGSQRVDVRGVKVKVCDTVGSGDAFTASLVLSYLKKESLQEIGEKANLWGAYVASQCGGTPHIDAHSIEGLKKAQ